MNLPAEKINQYAYELSVNNSQTALRALYLAFYPNLMSFILYYVKSEQVAEEIISDIFLVVWDKRAELSEIENLKSYIYRIAKNLAISFLRKDIVEPNTVDANLALPFIKTGGNPETELISEELMNRLNQAIDSLPEKCKLSFKLVREHGLRYKEAADVMEISVKTLEGHISLAVKKLRDMLSDDLYHT